MMLYEFVKNAEIYSTLGAELVYTTKMEPTISSYDGSYMNEWEYTEFWYNPKSQKYFRIIHQIFDKRNPPFLWFGRSRLEYPPEGGGVLVVGYGCSKDEFFDLLCFYSREKAVESLRKIDKYKKRKKK